MASLISGQTGRPAQPEMASEAIRMQNFMYRLAEILSNKKPRF